ncbi:DUF3139 domain-containing protein [Bacillus pseudomycoides]|uniref:DUF3139 domain-containing protein n=1 Tax=Bacillus pseudomycoides TaxID=64104 RepID=UPI000BEBBE7D|nr:DUF3139 domain-containing protein [Bacillus pseudomycoides]PDX97281.1 hypothetical protein COO07_28295 [Bacillus pseudomycoides]PEI32117.1 hypothetical protein CN641_30530 [Bacillus pseudomycoides]PEK73627.1 hypothetical protein CN597_28515 [Bacillus pseudomycoides]PEM31649.1 hypothetical protein CN634_29230 [Bacillus pseudomycoides]PEM99703.1 hypothetical protein CN640_30000 [Bacillus pseudomycoides]
MKEKLKTIFIFLFTLYIFFDISKTLYDRYFVEGDPKEKEKALVAVMWHLQEKGYTQNDIATIEAYFDSKQTQYNAIVEFKDEPNAPYTYITSKNSNTGKIEASQDYYPENPKHYEEPGT